MALKKYLYFFNHLIRISAKYTKFILLILNHVLILFLI